MKIRDVVGVHTQTQQVLRDRIHIISLFSDLCVSRGWGYLKLDGDVVPSIVIV